MSKLLKCPRTYSSNIRATQKKSKNEEKKIIKKITLPEPDRIKGHEHQNYVVLDNSYAGISKS